MQNGKHRQLNEKQHAAIRLLLSGDTQTNVAKEIGITPETLSRWINGDSLFIAALNEQRRAAYDSVVHRMRSLAHAAVDALTVSLNSENEMIRLKTAQTILKMINLDDIAAPSGPTTPYEVEIAKEQNDTWKVFNL